MEEFLLLGQVPGTNLVITFGQWALFFSLLLAMAVVRIEYRRYQELKHSVTVTQALMAKRIDPTVLDQAAL